MNYKSQGEELRKQCKNLVYNFMLNNYNCQPLADGLRQSEIFRNCGLDWGNKENATSSNQQYWIVAILRDLEEEQKIQRDPLNLKWRLK